MNTDGTIIGKFVKFKANKCYNPNAGEQIAYGYVTNYIRHGCFGVVYSFEDGEFDSEMVHASRLEICPDDEIINAVDSALRWSKLENRDLIERIAFFNENGDTQSVANLKQKASYIERIYNNELIIDCSTKEELKEV